MKPCWTRSLSITLALFALTASTSAATNASPWLPAGTNARPGLVQNCPTPRVNEFASPVAISADRFWAADGQMTSGFSAPSSP